VPSSTLYFTVAVVGVTFVTESTWALAPEAIGLLFMPLMALVKSDPFCNRATCLEVAVLKLKNVVQLVLRMMRCFSCSASSLASKDATVRCCRRRLPLPPERRPRGPSPSAYEFSYSYSPTWCLPSSFHLRLIFLPDLDRFSAADSPSVL
jgi:hypothetical protein